MSHGLYADCAPPSRELLEEWLDTNHVYRAAALSIQGMDSESGWRVVAEEDVDPGTLLVSIPKTALLSARTCSLPALPVAKSSDPILYLSLCLLHEFRLGKGSNFFGYLQSLPRDIGAGIPVFWDLGETEEDGKIALDWLKGTEGEKELAKKQSEGVGLANIQTFYETTASLLPVTPSHPHPSPFSAFAHAFSLISSRAFLIDVYHFAALCPFADILNHSTRNHTCLASDEFVCDTCGSLKTCEHDRNGAHGNVPGDVPRRLAHLLPKERFKLEAEEDTVDMRAERGIEGGDEVFNTYGDVGDGRLLVEYGFIGEEFEDQGLTWELEQIIPPSSGLNVTGQEWKALCRRLPPYLSLVGGDDPDGDSLLCAQVATDPALLNLDQSGRVSINIFALLWLRVAWADRSLVDDAFLNDDRLSMIGRSAQELEKSWDRLQKAEQESMGGAALATLVQIATLICQLLRSRLAAMHRPDLSHIDLLDLCDSLDESQAKRQRLALALAINERSLLEAAIHKWEQYLLSYPSE